MRKWTNLKKAFTAITVCVFAALLLSGCDGGASLGNAKSYKFKPVFHFQTCDDNVWCLDVNGVLYKKGVEEREWKLQPEYYGEVIGYIEHSWTIHKVGFAEDDPDKNFLYTDFEYGRLDAQDLYYKDGFDLLPVGPDTVTRIEYHPPDGNRDTWISSEEVENVVTDPTIIKAFFEEFFNPSNIVADRQVFGKESDSGGLFLYSNQYPMLYVPDIVFAKGNNRYFVRWFDYDRDETYVEISADVAEALIGPGTLE